MAQLTACKFADHLPLHRLERILARHGVKLSRSTMCDWMAHVASMFRPVVDLMLGTLPAEFLQRQRQRPDPRRVRLRAGGRGLLNHRQLGRAARRQPFRPEGRDDEQCSDGNRRGLRKDEPKTQHGKGG